MLYTIVQIFKKKFLILKNHDFAVTPVTFAFLFFKINKLSVLPQTNINGNVTASPVTSLICKTFSQFPFPESVLQQKTKVHFLSASG